jgi:hypothetical protein
MDAGIYRCKFWFRYSWNMILVILRCEAGERYYFMELWKRKPLLGIREEAVFTSRASPCAL